MNHPTALLICQETYFFIDIHEAINIPNSITQKSFYLGWKKALVCDETTFKSQNLNY
jgi:hypothetical protein